VICVLHISVALLLVEGMVAEENGTQGFILGSHVYHLLLQPCVVAHRVLDIATQHGLVVIVAIWGRPH
jgi:hypothetical protein